ncbi:FG-GAP repeat domain-containing protein [Streptomyces sp. NPDC056222]|uniref:FG-GAP repeat domain-containing protein n=1 Tax=Streptomyces sp. NPDC056222 TaxID=3345749 RepID=UPI0035E38584
MPQRRLAAAVATVLAVAATGLATPAVAAAPSSPAAALSADQQDVLTMPAGTGVVISGPTGFLTSHPEGSTRVFTWTRHQDGVQTRLPGLRYGGSAGTDIVVRIEGTTYTYIDMSTGTDLVAFDTSALDRAYTPLRYMGTTLVAQTYINNHREVHLISKEQGQVVDRKLTGIPEGSTYVRFESSGPDTLIVHHRTRTDGVDHNRVSLVDVATASVVETYDALTTDTNSASAVSATHLAWIEWPSYARATLAVARRGSTEVQRTPLGEAYSMTVKLMGDWVVYGATGGGTSPLSTPIYRTTARSLTTGETVGLLDHTSYTTPTADGGLLATGGTVGQGEGVYRVALDEAGRPAASLLVATGVPTVLTLTNEIAPPAGAIDFDRNGSSLKASWTFSRHNAKVSLLITHTASGKQWKPVPLPPRTSPGPFEFEWNGTFSEGGLPAYNGAYSWTMTAKPANGIGPDVVRTGGFTVTRAVRPHDFNDNGTPDLLVRNAQGRLTAFDGEHVMNTAGTVALQPWDLGAGWNTYDQIVPAGNIAGAAHGDLVARDKSGVLWHHLGKGDGTANRYKIGAGWGGYNKITAGSDLNGDGKPDLLATDTSGGLYLYKGTGSWRTPYTTRVKIGAGWGIYNKITATGNIAGAPAGDVVARDAAGVLWLHLGKGDGTFAPRIKIGAEWNQYTSLVGVGDIDHDGRNDLIAHNMNSAVPASSLYLYKGTGSWSAPFASRRALYNYNLFNSELALGKVPNSLY